MLCFLIDWPNQRDDIRSSLSYLQAGRNGLYMVYRDYNIRVSLESAVWGENGIDFWKLFGTLGGVTGNNDEERK